MKGQAAIMEKVILMFFIVIILISLVLFLGWWNISQISMEKQKNINQRTLTIAKRMMTDPVFVKDDSMFDDSKLLVANQTPCEAFEKMFGSGWFAEVSKPDGTGWSLCVKNAKSTSYVMPVNIYDHETETVSIGNLKVGVYR